MEKLQKYHTVKLTANAKRIPSGIAIRQHDYGTDTLCAEITDTADLSACKNRTFMIFRHGGTVTDEYACDISGNTVFLKVPNAVVSVCGFWLAEIHFYDEQDPNRRASSSTFTFNVVPDIDPSDSASADESVETLYSKIAEYCAEKIDELGAMRFSVVGGNLTVTFADDTTYDLGSVKGQDAVTHKGTVTLQCNLWNPLSNTYTFPLPGLGENGTVFFKPHTAADKTLLENADCFITSSGVTVTAVAETVPQDDITLEYVLIGG